MTGMYNKLIDALRMPHDWTDVSDCMRYDEWMRDAADAIERLVAEVDRKDKAIQGLLDAVDKKNTDIEKWKAAWKTAYKLYKATKESKGEQDGEQGTEQNKQ